VRLSDGRSLDVSVAGPDEADQPRLGQLPFDLGELAPAPDKACRFGGEVPTRGVLESFDLARLDYYMKYHIRRPSRTHRDQSRTAENREALRFEPSSGSRMRIWVQLIGRGPGLSSRNR